MPVKTAPDGCFGFPPSISERPLPVIASFCPFRPFSTDKTPPYAAYGGVLPCEMEFEKVVQHPKTGAPVKPAVGGEGLHRMKKRTCKSVVTILQLDCNSFVTLCQPLFEKICNSFLTFLLLHFMGPLFRFHPYPAPPAKPFWAAVLPALIPLPPCPVPAATHRADGTGRRSAAFAREHPA